MVHSSRYMKIFMLAPFTLKFEDKIMLRDEKERIKSERERLINNEVVSVWDNLTKKNWFKSFFLVDAHMSRSFA